MNVKDIINLMGVLSLTSSNITEDEKLIFLTYLNLAHSDLYAKSAYLNQDLIITDSFTPDLEDGDLPSIYTLSMNPLVIENVYVPSISRNVRRVYNVEYLQYDPGNNRVGIPHWYLASGKTITLKPDQTTATNCSISYIPMSKDFTIYTLEADIPYPPQYHNVLADGALYYVYQDAGGFRSAEKEAQAKMRWDDGTQKMINYLKNSTCNILTTFSST